MQTQRAKITLAAPPQVASTDQWAQIWSGLAAQFPLRNLHWKPATRTSIRTIQTLEVNVLSLDSVKEEGTSQIPMSLLDKPFLNMYVVVCEDNDTYKNTVKKQIKDWYNQVSQRRSQEWLILLVAKSESRQSQTGLLKMRGTVLDRIRADFNVDKKDRCAQLTWTADYKNPAAWAEIISKVKDGIISAFDQAVSQREEEVKRSELQKTMPGWNFCTFFILKESLANSFEGGNLSEDALIQYEELEASFFQVLKDKTLWFGNFVEPSPKDDSLPLLSITKKPYRDLIIANTISVFDIRVYLLARQSNLLGQMGRVTDIIRKVAIFLTAFGGRLRDFKTVLPDCFIESWIYSSALNAVESCDEWARDRETDSTSLASFNAAKGELIALSRNQLDILGIRLGYLPNEPPFSACAVELEELGPSGSLDADRKRISAKITNTDILRFIDSKTSFYDLYIRSTNKAIDLFVRAGRRKFALKLHGSLAALDLYRERHSTAFQTYTSLPAHYAPHRWSSLESYMLFQSIETHSRMQGAHDRQWIHTAMAFIKAYVEDNALELLSGVKEKNVYIERLVETVIDASSRLDVDLPFQEQAMISVHPLIDSGRCAEEQDGYFLDVILTNQLQCDLMLDKITLILTGRNSEIMEFVSGPATAKPGPSTLTLFCPIPMAGSFLADKAEIRLARLLLQWSFNGKIKRRQSFVTMDKVSVYRKLVKLPMDPRAVQVNVQQPLNVEVGGSSRLSVTLASGRNVLLRALLKFTSLEVTIHTKEAVSQSANGTLTFLTDGVSIVNTDADEIIRFDIPHSSATGRDMKVLAELEYVTTKEPEIVRRMSFERVVPTALALTVNVQDFFRGEKLLTKFIISTTTHQHVRIASVGLRPSDNDRSSLRIVGDDKSQGIITVTPAQPASFIFQLESQGEVSDPLRLCITYRLLREEVEELVIRRIKRLIPEPSGWKERDAAHESVIRALEDDSSWVELYEITGEVHVPESDPKASAAPSELFARARQILRESPAGTEDGGDWRQLIIPVDLPRLDILATTSIDIVANPFDKKPTTRCLRPTHIYTGQPITAIVSINASFYWAGHDKDIKQYRMRFELQENIKDWLLSGQKRGEFVAKNGSTHYVSVTLMALRHGEIPLPNVRVSALTQTDDGASTAPPSLETYQVHGAERLLVLPRGGRTTYFLNVDREQ